MLQHIAHIKRVFLKRALLYICRVYFVRFLPPPADCRRPPSPPTPTLACHPPTLVSEEVLTLQTQEDSEKSCRCPVGISQINRLAGLSYVQFWNINKTFESRGGGEREMGKGAGHCMMVFNVLLNRYKLFWPWPSVFGGSQWKSKSGHAMGDVWWREKSGVELKVQGSKRHSDRFFKGKIYFGKTFSRGSKLLFQDTIWFGHKQLNI